MSTQYDNIGAAYGEMHKMPAHRLADANLELTLKPLVAGKKVLDLASGLGRYSRPLASKWGANHVLGVDISSAMIEAARKATPIQDYGNKVEYQLGDCSKPTQYSQGPFDVVLGSWFLNYAPDYATQLEMWKNVAINLAPGGTFVGVVPPATEDPKAYTLAVEEQRPYKLGTIIAQFVGELPDGVTTRIVAGVEPQDVVFDQYHMKKSVYERAAREAGMGGEFEWRGLIIPDNVKDDPMAPEWQTYLEVPNCSFLVVKKS